MNKQTDEGYSRSPFPVKRSEWHLIVKIQWKRTCVADTIKLTTGPLQHFDLLLAPLSAQLGPTEF